MMETLLYLGIIMLMAGFIQGFSGFGSVLLSLPLLVISFSERSGKRHTAGLS